MEGSTGTQDQAERRYAGASADERRSDRRARLIVATLDSVADGGVAALTVNAICARASVSKRYFYESFDSLDVLLSATLTESLADAARRIDTAAPHPRTSEDADPESLTTVAVDAILSVFDDPRVARLYLESAANAALLDARDRAVDGFVHQLLSLVTGRTEHSPPADMMARVLISGTTQVVGMWLRGEYALTRDELVHHLARLGGRTAELVRSVEHER